MALTASGYPVIPVESEEQQVRALYKMLLAPGRSHLVGPDGVPQEIPESVYKILLIVVARMQEGQAVAVFPLMEELTTKATSNMLGMSRQYLVRLLEQGKIPFHRTGTHRRIYLKDVLDYQKKRDLERHESVKKRAPKSRELG
jgi:excisionase family DNA binding protein